MSNSLEDKGGSVFLASFHIFINIPTYIQSIILNKMQ
jgi:hypothetical protein